ncbi:long-chain fatty acid transport protein [Pontibacter ummariensis]|uniref:Long-chain fatty acid transport protein n=1 Tax=Pontibacter ummariensis TaxID=1610492 RepID=A0A239CRT7_9BACT|nr:OmpP1/FadL family transporter [Pontibacter ummariensis]PRY14862.1 long-chain fatty acid transport protein [Pontibacter ummariensis]SNS22840.1 long-chain fatty acid transport protein [Pontibacter ummariensis]
MKSKILALLGGTLLSASAMAGGYQVNLASQRQIGMGHTGTGIVAGTSSIFFNPGAMSFLRENGVTIGASAIVSKIAYRSTEFTSATANTDNPIGTPFEVYAVYGITEKLKAGLGVYTPFGSTVNWGDEWNGRFGLTQLSLEAAFIQPTLSYQISDKVGVGAGLVIATGGVNLQRQLPLQGPDGTEPGVELDGGANTGFGFNAGIYFQPTEAFSIGIDYRSRIDLQVEGGEVSFSDLPSSASALFQPGTEFSAELPLPSTLTVGVGYRPNDRVTLAVDVSRVGWSAYEKLRFDYTKPVGGRLFSENARNYDDAYIYRIGGEYKSSDALTLRAGVYYDTTPVNNGYLTPETPDANALGLSAGLTYHLSDDFSVDASFLYVNKEERTDPANLSGGVAGTFKSVAYIPGIGLNYKF